MNKEIRMAPREVLLSIAFIDALAEALKALREMGVSRRKMLDWLAEVIFGLVEDGWIILDWDGEPIEIDDEIIDRAHGDDLHVTWPSTVIRSAGEPRKRRPRQSMLLRLGLYDIAFKAIGRPIQPED